MYAVAISDRSHLALIVDDPRLSGYDGPVETVQVEFPEGIETVDELYKWPDGAEAPELRLGRDPDDASRYKIFRNDRERQNAGFVSGAPNFSVHATWLEVARVLDLRH